MGMVINQIHAFLYIFIQLNYISFVITEFSSISVGV